MVYREHGMWEVLEVLRRAHRGEKLRAIVRSTGRSRNTVRRYLSAAGEFDWRPGEVEPDESLAARVWARLRPGPAAADPSDTARLLLPQRNQIRRWLHGVPWSVRYVPVARCHPTPLDAAQVYLFLAIVAVSAT